MKRMLMAVSVVATLAVAAVAVPAPAGAVPSWDLRSISVSGTYRPVVGDFQGEGRTAILWYAPGPAADSIWIGRAGGRDAGTPFTVRPLRIDGRYDAVLAGNFVHDGRDDVLFYDASKGVAYLWATHGPGQFTSTRLAAPVGSRPLVLHDEHGGADDVFWYGSSVSELWHFDDAGSGTYVGAGGSFVPSGGRAVTGDFDGDGYGDVFVHVPGPGADRVAYVGGNAVVTSKAARVDGSYRPVVIPEGGRDAILWWGDGPAPDNLWRGAPGRTFRDVPLADMGYNARVTALPDAQAVVSGAHTPERRIIDLGEGAVTTELGGPPQGDEQVLVGDFDLDGRNDLFWYGRGDRPDRLWYAAG